MRLILRVVGIAAVAACLPTRVVEAQVDVGYVCAFGYNVYDKIAWVGRNIVRVQAPEHIRHTPGHMADLVNADFSTRIRGTYSQEDMNVTNRVSVNGFFGQFTSGHSTVDEAQRACLAQIEDHRREGYDVHGVGSPIFNGRDGMSVQHLGFLSALEFPNYVPGTIAARARQREASGQSSSGGSTTGSTSSGPRWVNGVCYGTWWECETPAQARERLRRQRETSVARARQLTNEADALYDRRDYRTARDTYARVVNYPRYQEIRAQQEYARERVQYIDANLAALEYSSFSAATGMSFGFAFGQSALEADGTGLMAALMKKETFGLPLVYSWGTGRAALGQAFGEEGYESIYGEFTRYTLGVSTTIPKLNIGEVALQIGYQFQKTDRREMHLMTSGVVFGIGTGPSFRFDVTPVYGKLQFGGSAVFDFSDIFD